MIGRNESFSRGGKTMLLGNYCVAGVVCVGLVFSLFGQPAGAKDDKNGAVTISTKFPGGNVLVEKNEGGTVRVAPDLRGDNPWFYWYFEAAATQPGRVNFTFPEKLAGVKNGAIGHQG